MDRVQVEDEEDAQRLPQAYMEFNKNIRMYTNGGYTPLELREKSGPVDFENVEIDPGPNIRDRLMEEDDPEELIRNLERFVGPADVLVCGNTLQVNDYSIYNWTYFDPDAKKKHHDETFAEYLSKAFTAGADLIK